MRWVDYLRFTSWALLLLPLLLAVVSMLSAVVGMALVSETTRRLWRRTSKGPEQKLGSLPYRTRRFPSPSRPSGSASVPSTKTVKSRW